MRCSGYVSLFTFSSNEIGMALYVAGSVFEHSCVPNAAPTYRGTHMTIRALKTIKEGEKVVINYVDLKRPLEERREALRRHYYIECKCERCVAEAAGSMNLAGVTLGERTSGGGIGPGERRWPNGMMLALAQDFDKQFDDILDAANEQKNWQRAFKLSIDAFEIYKHCYDEYHPDVTVMKMRIAKVRVGGVALAHAIDHRFACC